MLPALKPVTDLILGIQFALITEEKKIEGRKKKKKYITFKAKTVYKT